MGTSNYPPGITGNEPQIAGYPDCARCGHTADQHEHSDDEGVAERLYWSWCSESWADPDDAAMGVECDCAGYIDTVPA